MKILKVIGFILFFLILLGAFYYFISVGVTKEQKYYNCVEKCEELIFNESNKRFCPAECRKVVGYTPDEKEKETNKSSQPKPESKNLEESISPKISPSSNLENEEYYCQWIWPQKIINKETKAVIVDCPREYPWCNHADFQFQNVGCCAEEEYENCLSLSSLIK